MAIDLGSFKKALDSLDKAIRRAKAAPDDEELRDAVIQRFEYSYELSWKSLKRVLESDAPTPEEIDSLSFKDLIRRGAEAGLVADPAEWFAFREGRNITSHTYDAGKAKAVFDTALKLAGAARTLLIKLESRTT